MSHTSQQQGRRISARATGRAALALGITGLVGALMSAQNAPPPQPGEAAPVALIEIVVDNSYSTAASLQQVDFFADVVPPVVATVTPNDTLSEVIATSFNFGASNLKAVYDRLEAAILRLNGLERPSDLKAGPLLLPALPRWGFAARRPAASRELALQPLSADLANSLQRLTGREIRNVSDVRDVIGEANNTVVRVEVPLAALGTSSGRQFLRDPSVRVQAAPIRLAFPQPGEFAASRAGADPNASLTTQLKTLLVSPKRHVVLFVIDSGWPNASSHRSSVAYLASLANDAGKKYDITSTTQAGAFTPAKASHCEGISEALQAFEQADAQDAVRVVYVPTTRDQGASRILTELVHVSLVIQRENSESRGGRFPLSSKRLKEIVNDARLVAQQVVQALPPDARGKEFSTDQALVDAVIQLAHAVASRNTDSFFVVNESWTLPGGAFDFRTVPAQRGLTVAAAGNEPKRDIFTEPIVDYAGRSKGSAYVVAVLNMDAAGALVCRSSTAGTTFLADARVVGFDGSLASTCGTSFAAPRVAWLIAAAEAIRKASIPPTDWPLWIGSHLKATRRNAVLDGLLLDPVKFLQLASQ